jgi:hypothetical protein
VVQIDHEEHQILGGRQVANGQLTVLASIVRAQAERHIGIHILQEEAAVAQPRQLVGQADFFQRLVGPFQFQILFQQLFLGSAERLQRGAT